MVKMVALAVALLCSGSDLGRKPTAKPKEDPKIAQTGEAVIEAARRNDSAGVRELVDKLGEKAPAICPFMARDFLELDEKAQLLLARAMVGLKCPETVEMAKEAFVNIEGEVKGPLAVEFAALRDPALLEPLVALVEKGRPFEKEKGCEALALLGLPEGVRAVAAAAGNSLFSVRLAAALALARFPGEEGRGVLCGMVARDANAGVRGQAARSLGERKELPSVPCLIVGLDDQNNAVRTDSHAALVATTGLDVGLSSESWKNWWDKNQPGKKNR